MWSGSEEGRDSALALAATHWAAVLAVVGLGVALVFLAPSVSRSAENDSIESAEPIASLPHRTEGIDVSMATTDADDPRPACAEPRQTLWYALTLDGDTPTSVRVVPESATDDALDLTVAAWKRTPAGELEPAGCVDDRVGSQPEQLVLAAPGDGTLYLEVGTVGAADPSGSYTLAIDRQEPEQDLFAFARPIGTARYSAAGVDTIDSRLEPGEPRPSCADIAASIWYRVPASEDGVLAASVRPTGTDDERMNVAVAVYEGDDIDSLHEVGCTDDAGAVEAERVEVPLRAGHTYAMQVGAVLGAEDTLGHFTLEVLPRQRIDLAPVPDTVLGGGPQALAAEAASGLPVSFTASGPCVIEGGAVRATGAGTCTITASQGGDADWAPAAKVSTELRIARARQRIDLAPVPDTVLGGGPQALAAEAASGLPVSFTASGPCVIEGGAVRATGAGTCTITASQGGDADWAPAAKVSTELRIARARQRIDLAPVPDTVLGGGPQALAAEAASGLPVSFTASGPCVIEGGAVRATGAGTCTITASQGGDADWAPARRVETRMRIARGRQRIELTAPSEARMGAPIDLSAVADSGLPVALEVTGACIVDGTSIRPIGTGTCAITASQAGDADWTAADAATTRVRIGRGRQDIELAALSDSVFGAEPQPLEAGSGSGLRVSLTTTGPCSARDGAVHATGAGICTVVASQAGDVDWEAAPVVRRSFRIVRATQRITFPALDRAYLGDAPIPLAATSTSPLAVTYVASGPCAVDGDRLHALDAGECTVTAYQPGNADWSAAREVRRSFDIIAPLDEDQELVSGTVATERPGTLVTTGARITSGFADGRPHDGVFAVALEAGDELVIDGVDRRMDWRISGPLERSWHELEIDEATGTARWPATEGGIHSVRLRDGDSALGPSDRYTIGFTVERPAGRPPTRAALERDLLIRAGPWSCRTWRAKQDPKPFADGALAGIACDDPMPGISRVTLLSFPDAERLDGHLAHRMGGADALGTRDVRCSGPGGDPVRWQHGQVGCWVSRLGSTAQLHWTDETRGLYGVMESAGGDLAALYDRWAEGPLGPG